MFLLDDLLLAPINGHTTLKYTSKYPAQYADEFTAELQESSPGYALR